MITLGEGTNYEPCHYVWR